MAEQRKRSITIIGAGIAGLTAAHELAELGHDVHVYESEAEAGGFFRSAVLPEHDGMPSEYSWHGFGPWYHNTFAMLRKIRDRTYGKIYSMQLSRPIDFGLAFDDGSSEHNSVRRMFKMAPLDAIRWAWLMLQTWTANRRSAEHYSQINAAEAFESRMSERAWRAWRACFGPWIGSDWSRVSLHHVGQFFRRNMFSGRKHAHSDWSKGHQHSTPWKHGGGDGWLVLKGPSSEAWFRPWVVHLKSLGVTFHFGMRLDRLRFQRDEIVNAIFDDPPDAKRGPEWSGKTWAGDLCSTFVLALGPFAARDVFSRSLVAAQLEHEPERGLLADLELVHSNLISDGPHTQVSFRIAFLRRIQWKRTRQAVVLADSEWNITIFAQEQVWSEWQELGKGVQSLWTGTACVSHVPGRVFGLPLEQCTREQFETEILAQIDRCLGLRSQIDDENWCRRIVRFEVWHEWLFRGAESISAITPRHPKWVTSTTTQRHKPDQRTAIPNLVLAGAHTKTEADVWSIEGAVESGRRAARLIDPRVEVLRQHKPVILRAIARLDDVCWALGLPHVLTLLGWALIVVVALGLAWRLA